MRLERQSLCARFICLGSQECETFMSHIAHREGCIGCGVGGCERSSTVGLRFIAGVKGSIFQELINRGLEFSKYLNS